MAREPTSCKIIKMNKETNVLTESYSEASHQLQDFDQWASGGVPSTKKNLTWVLPGSVISSAVC